MLVRFLLFSIVLVLSTTVSNTSCSTIDDIDDEQICEEMLTFIPNVCHHEIFRAKCKQYCAQGHSELTCGTRSTYSQRKRRIIGGYESDIGEWPWHVSLQWKGEHMCGASILSPHLIMTAAHCIELGYTSQNPAEFTVLAGTNRHAAPGKRLRVHSFKNHPGYNLTRHPRKDFLFVYILDDISVVRLQDKIDLGSGNRDSICLPDSLNPFPSRYPCYIVGYGLTSDNYYSKIWTASAVLNDSPFDTVPIDECNRPKAFNNTVSSNTTVCAGDGTDTVSPCNFDSGGGLVCHRDGTWFLRGITSSGYRCGDNDSYAMFANVANYEDWIIKSIFELYAETKFNTALPSTPTVVLIIIMFFYTVFTTVPLTPGVVLTVMMVLGVISIRPLD